MTVDDMSNAVASLRVINARPLCDKHEPIADLIDGMIQIHCLNCGFTAWVHPQSYLDMITEEA